MTALVVGHYHASGWLDAGCRALVACALRFADAPVGEIMTFRLTQLPFAALALGIAAVALTDAPARAFTQENLSANQNGGSRFADPDDQVKNFGHGGTQLFGPNGPTVQFGAQQGPGQYSPFSPFNRFQGNGFNSPPPDPYARPLGNGD
jgi:hypothetical protein